MGIFGQNAQANRESLCASAISRCAKSFLRRKFRRDITSLRTHTEEFGSRLERETSCCFETAFWK